MVWHFGATWVNCLFENGLGIYVGKIPVWERRAAFLGEVHYFAGDLSHYIGHR